MKYNNLASFTLAEVLITLGIIGVVAAITMPALIQSYKKQEASARLKKFNSMMQQAIIMSESDNGKISDWTYTETSDNVTGTMVTKEFFMAYLAKYIKYTKIQESKTSDNRLYVYMPDGSYFSLYRGDCIDFFFDINGDKSPNKEGRDIFRFLACPPTVTHFCNGKSGWCSYYLKSSSSSREARLTNCKNKGMYCSGLLEYDNWEFKSDYPYRL